MRPLKYLFVGLTTCLLLVTCKGTEEPSGHSTPPVVENAALTHFMAQTQYGLYKDKAALFTYDEATHQIAYNAVTNMFRIQNDAVTKMAQTTCSKKPVANESLTVTVAKEGVSGLQNSYTADVKKVDATNHKAWLWVESASLGFIVYLP